MKSKLTLLAGLLAAWALLAACQLNVETRIDADGSGVLTTEIGFTEDELQQLSELDGGDSETVCDELQSGGDLPEGATVERQERDGEIFCVISQPFAGLDELRALYDDMEGVTINELSLDNGRLVYDVDVDFSDAEGTPGFGFSSEWRVTVPGAVEAHNADAVDGNTLTWEMTPGDVINMRAESSGGFAFGTLALYAVPICLCLLCVAALGGGGAAFFIVRQRRAAAAAQSGPPAAPSM
jgi:hypothetical protein